MRVQPHLDLRGFRQLVLAEYLPDLSQVATRTSGIFARAAYPRLTNLPPELQQAQLQLFGLFSDYQRCALDLMKRSFTSLSTQEEEFSRFLGRQLLQIADEICGGNWELMHRIWATTTHMEAVGAIQVPKAFPVKQNDLPCLFWLWVNWIGKALHHMVGTSTRILVGTRSNHPAWMDLPQPLTTREEVRNFDFPIDSQLAGIGQDDIHLIPDLDRPKAIDFSKLPVVKSLAPSIRLMQVALDNPTYEVDPTGVHVRVQGMPGVKSVDMKVRRLDDEVGFLARVNLENGWRIVWNDYAMLCLLWRQQHFDRLQYPDGRTNTFFLCLLVRIFYDLVRGRTIVEAQSKRKLPSFQRTEPNPRRSFPGYPMRFIYIPRGSQRNGLYVPSQVRTLAKPRKSPEPHQVLGHPRRGRITPEQLARVREAGIELPDGYTWVFDHSRGHGAPVESELVRPHMLDAMSETFASGSEKLPDPPPTTA